MAKKQIQKGLHPLFLMLLTLFLICGTASNPLEAGEKTTITFKTDWHHGIQFLGFYAAQKLGFYSKENLDVSIRDLTAISELDAIPDGVAEGRYEFGIGTYVLPLAQKKGLPIVAVASIYQFGPNVFFAKVESNIKKPIDFKGKRIVVKGEAWKVLLKEFLSIAHLTLADVVPVDGGYDMTPFYKGEVDIWAGYITNEPILARQKGYKLNTFPAYEYGLHYLGNSIYTSTHFFNRHPEIVTSFLRASVKGWEFAVENPDKALDLMFDLFPEKKKDAAFHLQSFESSIPLISPPGKKIGELDCQTYKKNPILNTLAATSDLCDQSILDAIWKEFEKK